MTQEEAQKELYSYLTPKDGAMIPIGYVDNLINKIYKDFEEELKISYEKGYFDCHVAKTPKEEILKFSKFKV